MLELFCIGSVTKQDYAPEFFVFTSVFLAGEREFRVNIDSLGIAPPCCRSNNADTSEEKKMNLRILHRGKEAKEVKVSGWLIIA